MYSFVLYPLLALGLFLLYKLILSGFAKRRKALRAAQLGCEPAPALPDDGFLGLRSISRALKADREKRLVDMIAERFALISKQEHRNVTTMQFYGAGATNISTIDPRNVQAILATQFKDFALGDARHGNLGALLGNGIVSNAAPVIVYIVRSVVIKAETHPCIM
jgi:hypothetical protein